MIAPADAPVGDLERTVSELREALRESETNATRRWRAKPRWPRCLR